MACECCSCKASFPKEEMNLWMRGEKQYGRCKGCANWSRRFSGVLQGMPEDIQKVMVSMSPEDKKDFMVKNSQFLGDQLKKAIETYAEKKCQRSTSQAFSSNSQFLDETDLAKRFEGKPEQLAAVKRNARTIEDPVREVTLYEVRDFAFASSDSMRETEEHSLSLSSKDVAKAKKPKTEAGPGRAGLAKVRKLQPKLQEKVEEVGELVEMAAGEEYKDFVPNNVLQRARLDLASAKEDVASLQMASSSDWAGSPVAVAKSCGKTLSEIAKTTKKLQGYLKEATKTSEQAGQPKPKKEQVEAEKKGKQT